MSPKIVISSDFARIGRLTLKVDSSWRTVVSNRTGVERSAIVDHPLRLTLRSGYTAFIVQHYVGRYPDEGLNPVSQG